MSFSTVFRIIIEKNEKENFKKLQNVNLVLKFVLHTLYRNLQVKHTLYSKHCVSTTIVNK